MTGMCARPGAGAPRAALWPLVLAGVVAGWLGVAAGERTPACIDEFDPTVDYFPYGANANHTNAFTTRYHGYFKSVAVDAPTTTTTYLLRQCGAPEPLQRDLEDVGLADADPLVMVNTPLESVGVAGPGLLTFLHLLAEHTSLVLFGGWHVDDVQELSPCIQALILDGRLDLEDDAINEDDVVAHGLDAVFVSSPDLAADVTSVPVIVVPFLLEEDPLARYEWIEFLAAFFNREEDVEQMVEDIERRFACHKHQAQLSAEINSAPNVLYAAYDPENGVWMPGPDFAYMRHVIQAAGGLVLEFPLDALSPEQFEDLAMSARVFLYGGDGWDVARQSIDDWNELPFYFFGRTWATDLRPGDWAISRHAEPDLELEDLIDIVHPGILTHQRRWLRRVQWELQAPHPSVGSCGSLEAALDILHDGCPADTPPMGSVEFALVIDMPLETFVLAEFAASLVEELGVVFPTLLARGTEQSRGGKAVHVSFVLVPPPVGILPRDVVNQLASDVGQGSQSVLDLGIVEMELADGTVIRTGEDLDADDDDDGDGGDGDDSDAFGEAHEPGTPDETGGMITVSQARLATGLASTTFALAILFLAVWWVKGRGQTAYQRPMEEFDFQPRERGPSVQVSEPEWAQPDRL